jgi:HlyD family secretion protein
MTESEIRIGSAGPGQVVAVKVRRGERVKKGQILALLDDAEQKAGVLAAGAQVTTAELGDLRAERDLGQILGSMRRQGLLPETLSPDDLLDGAAGDAQLKLLQTTAQAAKQHAALQLARSLLARRTIRAPASGVVLSRSVEPGESIPASPPGPPLFTIGSDPATLRLEVEIDERYVAGVRPGPATFTTPGRGGYPFSAAIENVVPLEKAVRSPAPYAVLLTVPNADGALSPGTTAVVELLVATPREALHVPVAALRTDPADSSLLWLPDDDGRPVATPVEVGVTDGQFAEVQGPGLAAGRLVVTDESPSSCLVQRPPSPFGGGEP